VTNEHTGRYGPGHNSFTVAEDGVTDVLVYHARDYRDITGDPLYDPNRHTRVQRLYWHPDGTPLFGVPVGAGGPIVRLSPAAGFFINHADSVLRAVRAPHDLGATQFRFVAAADGTETIQSVDRPDLHIRVDGDQVRLDPAATPVRRVRVRNGVQIQAGDRYLRLTGGLLTAGESAAVFRLS
jgi:glycosyl hydrolase family 43